MKTYLRRFAIFFFFLLPVLFLISCAPTTTHYAKVNQGLLQQDYDYALKLIEENKENYAERNAALYYLEKGIVSHYALQYQESNDSLAKAESIMDELYTKSISKQVSSFLISDNTIPYRGEDFENAMVNLFMALNYIGLGLEEDALVEARKVDNKLNIINSQYEEDKKNIYKEDAFIRFLMGVLYETGGELNDSFISYRKAEEIYTNDYSQNYGVSPSSFLIENLLSAAQAMDFQEEISEFQRKYPGVNYMNPAEKKEMAEIYCIHYNGLGPVKAEKSWLITMPDAYVAKIAYPIFERRGYQVSQSEITLKNLASNSSYQFTTVLMEDIGSIAIMNLENRMGRIKTKAIARATTKYLVTKASSKVAKDQGGSMLGLLVQVAGNIASVATEQADIRHWRLLPAEIRVGRVVVPPGDYEGKIEFVHSNGGVVSSRRIERFKVQAGEKRFLIYLTRI